MNPNGRPAFHERDAFVGGERFHAERLLELTGRERQRLELVCRRRSASVMPEVPTNSYSTRYCQSVRKLPSIEKRERRRSVPFDSFARPRRSRRGRTVAACRIWIDAELSADVNLNAVVGRHRHFGFALRFQLFVFGHRDDAFLRQGLQQIVFGERWTGASQGD